MIIVSKELISKIGSKEVLRNVNLLVNGKEVENSDIAININDNDYCLEYVDSDNPNLLCELTSDYVVFKD